MRFSFTLVCSNIWDIRHVYAAPVVSQKENIQSPSSTNMLVPHTGDSVARPPEKENVFIQNRTSLVQIISISNFWDFDILIFF